MERYSARKVDELGRIVLHSELRKKLGIKAGDKITLMVVGSIVVIQPTDSAGYEINELGMFTIPGEIRQKFAWEAGNEIAIYHTDSLLILKTP